MHIVATLVSCDRVIDSVGKSGPGDAPSASDVRPQVDRVAVATGLRIRSEPAAPVGDVDGDSMTYQCMRDALTEPIWRRKAWGAKPSEAMQHLKRLEIKRYYGLSDEIIVVDIGGGVVVWLIDKTRAVIWQWSPDQQYYMEYDVRSDTTPLTRTIVMELVCGGSLNAITNY